MKNNTSKKEKVCTVCGKIHTNPASDLCYKHYEQMKKYGKIICANSRTVFDMNEVRILSDYCEIDTYDSYGRVLKTFKFDKEDLPLIYKHKWQCVVKGKTIKSYYLVTTINKKRQYFHRIVLGNPIGEIDHINIDSTDNRKCNLRVSTRSQQVLNTRKRISIASKYKGVYYNKNRAKTSAWHAELQIETKCYYSPWYGSEEEAIFARNIMEQIFKAEVYQDKTILESAIEKLTENQKNNISKCLLNKWKH